MDRLPARTLLLLVLLAFATALPAAPPAARGWNVVDLGPSSYATAINQHHDVVGYAYAPAPNYAFLWMRGALVNLGVIVACAALPDQTSAMRGAAISERRALHAGSRSAGAFR